MTERQLPNGWKIIGGTTIGEKNPEGREITEEEVDRLLGLSRGLSFEGEVHEISLDDTSCAQTEGATETVWDLLDKPRRISSPTTPDQSA